jgi:hypothetical protein
MNRSMDSWEPVYWSIRIITVDYKSQTVGVGRQTELQREFPLHVVCSWLGNSARIAQQSYLLVSEDDFARAAGAKKVMVP